MAEQTTIDQIVDYYTELLIVQYNQLPKARAMVALFVEQLIADGIIFDVRDGYDIETAAGQQLDVLAKYIGADRFFAQQILEGYFAFALYDEEPESYDDSIGFCDYDDMAKPGLWLTYDGIVSGTYSIGDSDFRTLLKLKILQNNSNHSDKELNDGIFALFGNDLILIDNYDMTMTYLVNPSIGLIINIANQKGILPKPMGVGLDVQENNNNFLHPVLWLDGSDIDSMEVIYTTLPQTVTGAAYGNTVTASADVSSVLEVGNIIRINNADNYTIGAISGVTITTLEPLIAFYPVGTSLRRAEIEALNDKTSFDNNAEVPAGAQNPIIVTSAINGKTVLKFQSGALFIENSDSLDPSGGFSLYIVIQRLSDTGVESNLIRKWDAEFSWLINDFANDTPDSIAFGFSSDGSTADFPNINSLYGNPFLAGFVSGEENNKAFVNNDENDSSTKVPLFNNADGILIGQGTDSNFYLAEVIAFQGAVPEAQDTYIRNYLNTKWNT